MSDHAEWREYPQLFRTRDAAARGITRYGLCHDPRFLAIIAGVHIDERTTVQYLTPSWADEAWMSESLRLRAAVLVIPGIAAGHNSAARLFGLPLPNRLRDDRLHLVTRDSGRKVSRKGLTVRRRREPNIAVWFGLPMCSPVGLFLDLAAVLSVSELVAVGDAIVGNWHGPPLCSLEQLQVMIAECRYLRNRATVEGAVELIRETVDSPQETGLRLWLISRGLPEPVVHPQVFCPLLNRIVEPDLGYQREKLALEYEGDHHRASKKQWSDDIARDEALRQEGWVVLRVTARTNRAELEHKIRHHLGAPSAR